MKFMSPISPVPKFKKISYTEYRLLKIIIQTERM